MALFNDRIDAGRQLAQKLTQFKGEDAIVLALPRGGVPVGMEVAQALDAPLDVFLVRKIGVPGWEELAMGAIATGGVTVFNEAIAKAVLLSESDKQALIDQTKEELHRREALYRGDRPPPDVRGRTVILVDDGLATGATMLVAVQAIKEFAPAKIVVAVPTASAETVARFEDEADQIFCVATPEPFFGVGFWYADFSQVSDGEVQELLERAGHEPVRQPVQHQAQSVGGRARRQPINELVRIDIGEVTLAGQLTIPEQARGLVLFAHGSGSSRLSPRNQFVARKLQEHNLGTLLIDLLSEPEERIDRRTRHLRFDIAMLGRRLVEITDWLVLNSATQHLKIGTFGASTGAAAALIAAAQRPDAVGAVVSRGGRPDLAGDALDAVQSPTLLIVGGEDHVVIELNKEAMDRLKGKKRLEIVPGATHLFEEPGALEHVANLSAVWFEHYLQLPDQPLHMPRM